MGLLHNCGPLYGSKRRRFGTTCIAVEQNARCSGTAVLFSALKRQHRNFYWPAGASAYLPTLAASLLLFWQAITGRIQTKRGQKIGCVCLLIAVGCSEAGAVLAITFALTVLLPNLFFALQQRRKNEPLLSFWWAIPGCLAVAVLAFVRFHRGSKPEGQIFLNSVTFGGIPWQASVKASAN